MGLNFIDDRDKSNMVDWKHYAATLQEDLREAEEYIEKAEAELVTVRVKLALAEAQIKELEEKLDKWEEPMVQSKG